MKKTPYLIDLLKKLGKQLSDINVDTSSIDARLKSANADPDPGKKDDDTPTLVRATLETPDVIRIKDETGDRNKKWYKDLTLLLQIVGAAIALGLGFVTYQQFKDSHYNFRIEERPWIIEHPGKLQTVEGEPIAQPLSFTNEGKTPALKVEIVFGMETVELGKSPTFHVATQHLRKKVMYPHEPTPPSVMNGPLQENVEKKELSSVVLDHALRERFEKGEIVFVGFGVIEYEDIYKRKHWARFCAVSSHNPPTKSTETTSKCYEYGDVDDNN